MDGIFFNYSVTKNNCRGLNKKTCVILANRYLLYCWIPHTLFYFPKACIRISETWTQLIHPHLTLLKTSTGNLLHRCTFLANTVWSFNNSTPLGRWLTGMLAKPLVVKCNSFQSRHREEVTKPMCILRFLQRTCWKMSICLSERRKCGTAVITLNTEAPNTESIRWHHRGNREIMNESFITHKI